MFLPHLLYIVYQIFRWAQIFVGFFRSRERSGAAGGFSGSFAKKISRAKHAQLEDTSLKKVPSFTNKIYHKICQIARIKLHIQYTIFSTKYNSKDAKPSGGTLSWGCMHSHHQSIPPKHSCISGHSSPRPREPSTPNPLSRI